MPQHEDMEIIRRLQLKNQTLKNKNRTLGETNKTLSANQWRSSSSTQIPDELKAFDAELATFSRKYGIIAEMFPPTHCILKLPVPNPPPAILSGSHYATKSAEELCLVTELYSLLPDHLHRFVPTTHFQSLLGHHLQGGRSSEIGKLRVMAGHIFGLDSSYFNTSFTKRDTILEIQKLLGQSSSKFPPVLFTRQEMDPTMSMVFGNWEPLAKAIRIVMFGKNSLDIVGWPRAKCNARKWGITLYTPGLLAWGWVVLIFILSPDTLFTKDEVGARSRLLNYGSHFGKNLTPTSPTIDTPAVIAPPVPPTVPAITPGMSPQATETIINPVPRSAVQLLVSLTGNTVNVPIVAVTMATDEFPPIVPAAVTAVVAAVVTDGPDVTAVSDIPGNGETLSQAVASGSSSARRG
ncbi:uncharacterized protein EDB91DRAFT_1252670 [Suillus paluster]|uniref:uncharacterized protein n=1 Tax=Suillus paluster TaxID=48578 RepID=UPI001B87A793|nr:uncharacterized protein EDB91DRAFT_1252670 [Suillus paluster]KAG1730406.1 hypothetical protein EDB91DRAFT_1252670 [Suillus paluster]